MLRGLYTAAFGMINNQTKQDVAANNIANSTTPGFKQDKVVSRTFPEVMLQNRDSEDGKTQKLGTMPFGVAVDGIYTDFNQGITEDTESDLDFAINGRGMFAVQYFDGVSQVTRYTRSGSFRLDADGMLVTQDGGYVMGRNASSGEVGPMELGSGSVVADSQGNVTVDSVLKYNIPVYDFDDYNNLEKFGNNMYGVRDNNTLPITMDFSSYSISQRKLEQSNVDLSSEMVDMITNLRSYQANQRVLTSIDETLGKAVNEVGSLK